MVHLLTSDGFGDKDTLNENIPCQRKQMTKICWRLRYCGEVCELGLSSEDQILPMPKGNREPQVGLRKFTFLIVDLQTYIQPFAQRSR
jgi:hypothetical protein